MNRLTQTSKRSIHNRTFRKMYFPIVLVVFVANKVIGQDFSRIGVKSDMSMIDVVDLTHSTKMKDLIDYFMSVEKSWKICTSCGAPGLGTVMHMEYAAANSPVFPAIIPTEYLVTRLVVINVRALAKLNPQVVLTLDVALQWKVLKQDPEEPTLLLFNFGYKNDGSQPLNTCDCHFPGLSYELASYIAENLTHVVGVATDAPSLESEQTRKMLNGAIAGLLGKAGIYMIENVNVRRDVPENGCLSISMPLKLHNANFVPTRLTAFCPSKKIQQQEQIVLTLKGVIDAPKIFGSRILDVDLDEILN